MKHVPALVVAVLWPLQQPESRGELRFNWPTGITARVETEFLHEFSDGQRIVPTSFLRITHRMRVLPHAEGRVIQYDNQTYVESFGDVEQGVTALLPFWVPSQVVSHEGRFLRMENTERVQQNVIDLFEAKGRNEQLQTVPAFKEYIRVMTSDAGLRGLAEGNWHDLVERWIAASLAEGPLEGVGPQLIPIEKQPPATISRRMIGRTACSRLEVSRECGIYEITTRRDRDQLVNLAKALTNSGAAGSANVTWLEETKTEQVSLESSTMLPHDYIITRTLTATRQQDGLTVPMINVERIHSVYTYVEER